MKRINSPLAALGRRGDTELAEVTADERRMLKRRGGSGTRNPLTGLKEYWAGEGDTDNGAGPGVSTDDSGTAGGGGVASPTEAPDVSITAVDVGPQAPPGVTGSGVTSTGEAPDDGPGSGMLDAMMSTPALARTALGLMMGPMSPGIAHMAAQGLGMLGQAIGATNTDPGDPNAPGDESEYPGGGPGAGTNNNPMSVYATPYGVESPIAMGGLAPLRLARGGSVAKAADKARGAGRGGDTEIVHLNPEEVEALRLAWGEPTINPETGAPEYFSLKKALKSVANIVIPAAATYFTGNPLVGAAASSLTGLATGDNLKSSIAKGLLAYGGGKLAQGFDVGGTGDLFDSGRISGIGDDFRNFGSSITGAFQGTGGGLSALGAGDEYQTFGEDGGIYGEPPAPMIKPTAAGVVGSDADRGSWWDRNKGLAVLGGTAALGAMAPRPQPAQPPARREEGPAPNWRFERVYKPNPDGSPGHDYFEDAYVNDDTGERIPMAEGGLATLREPRMLGPVRGDGGGQDDIVPAALSDGEYVVSADVVAALGDGSTEAGSKKLDALMANVRRHKTGSAKFPDKAKSPLAYINGGK